MGDFLTTFSTIISFMTTLFFWAGLVVIMAMLRKVMKDVADTKKTLTALEEVLLATQRPITKRPVEAE